MGSLQQKVKEVLFHGSEIPAEQGEYQSVHYYHQLVESLPAAIYTCDAEGRITFYNEAAAKLWGRNPDLGKDAWCGSWKIYHPDGTPMELDECPMAITLKEGKAVVGAEIWVERPDGVRRWIQPHPKPIFDSFGTLTGAVNMLVDITEKKEAEKLIRQSEKKYRELADSLDKKVEERTLTLRKKNEELIRSEDRYHKMVEEVRDYAILLLDVDGTILNWNQGAHRIKGYEANEIVGKNFKIFYLKEDQVRMLPEQLIREATMNGRATHEGWRVRKDGTTFWGSVVITALHDAKNNIIGFSKVTRDLTERKLAEDIIKQKNRELEFQNKELEQFAYVASHDLQEPLRKIQIFSDMLQKDLDDKTVAKKNLEKVNSSARRMQILIKDVLNYSRLARNDELFTETDLNQILDNVKSDFELLIEQKHAILNYPTLPVIKGIPIQLHQLFSNLISNSLKFCDRNPVITISWEKATNEEVIDRSLNLKHHFIKLNICDNGFGFEPHFANQLFKLFHRLNNTQPGTGIGLALCKKIVENHHGHISVSSVPNQGTNFTNFLPLRASAQALVAYPMFQIKDHF